MEPDELEGTQHRRYQLLERISREQVNIVRAVTAINMYFRYSAYKARPKLGTASKALMDLQSLVQELKEFDDRFPNPRFALLKEDKPD